MILMTKPSHFWWRLFYTKYNNIEFSVLDYWILIACSSRGREYSIKLCDVTYKISLHNISHQFGYFLLKFCKMSINIDHGSDWKDWLTFGWQVLQKTY